MWTCLTGPGRVRRVVTWRLGNFPTSTTTRPDEHIEDRMAQEAVAFMETHRSKPFFLNYWMFSVHAPFDAKQALIEQYKARGRPFRSATQPDLRGNDREHGRCCGHIAGYA